MTISTSILAITILAQPPTVAADPPEKGKSRADEFREYATREIATYTIRTIPGDRPLTLRADPVLRWSNPIVGEIYGDVFVWTRKGRPEAIGSLYRWYSPFHHSSLELVSLSAGPLAGHRDGREVWAPSRPGIVMKPIPGAPPPAGTPAGRLRQMRELAGEFSGRETQRNDVEREMRLLAQPLYRYDDHEDPIVDGALFVFVQGTDPETFLLIEARRVASETRWHYGLVRMNSVPMQICHRGQPVWSTSLLPWAQAQDPREPYTNFRIAD
jgi:hypothetical protein